MRGLQDEHFLQCVPAADLLSIFLGWNEESQQYWMLLAARLRRGPNRQRGCTALCASKDLKSWEVRDPLWAPDLYVTHECPDLFRMGEWWYLIFSEFSDAQLTRYRMSRTHTKGDWGVYVNHGSASFFNISLTSA